MDLAAVSGVDQLTGVLAKARRLRHLPVEKGLLREVKMVQRLLDSLIKCKVCSMSSNEIGLMEIQFYDDDLRDENTVLALRLLVKDLLVLFQAGNEGVCNILGVFQYSQARRWLTYRGPPNRALFRNVQGRRHRLV